MTTCFATRRPRARPARNDCRFEHFAAAYLILLEADHVLPALYRRVIIPAEVLDELQVERAPEKVQSWLSARPTWLEVRATPDEPLPQHLHRGEAAAIVLAKRLKADLLLIDDRAARAYAEGEGLRTTGLLGVLCDAAEQNLIDIELAFARLQQTNFRAPPSLYEQIAAELRRTRAQRQASEQTRTRGRAQDPER